MDSLQAEVCNFCKEYRILKKDFAAMISITPVMLAHWLKNRVTFSQNTIERIISVIDSYKK